METLLGEAFFPPCPSVGQYMESPRREEGVHGHPHHGRTEAAAPALPHGRPGSAGHQHGWAEWRKHLPSSSSPLGLSALSLGGKSGTAVGWTLVASRLWQTPAGPSSREMRSRSEIPESHVALANPARS